MLIKELDDLCQRVGSTRPKLSEVNDTKTLDAPALFTQFEEQQQFKNEDL